MNQQNANTLHQLVETYMQLWNEPDPAVRRQCIQELWVEDGAQFTQSHAYHGYQELEGRVTAAHNEFVRDQGYVFKPADEPGEHHNTIKLTWDMVPAAGGDVAAHGLIFLLLADDGRIRFDYQF